MYPKVKLFILIITIATLSSCEFVKNTFQYKETTKEFTEALINENYDKCVELFAMEHDLAQNLTVDTLKAGLPNFRKVIIENFGEDLSYTLMNSKKTFSTIKENNTAPNTTSVQVQYANQKEFGVLSIVFDDTSKKILNISPLDIKQKIPNMIPFWIFGIFAICIPFFNIYVINQIRKSDLKRKWLKYLAVLFFNVPAISYSAISGISLKLLSFQILFGISFGYMGYLNAMWAFGIPLGGMYWLWKLKTKKEEVEMPSYELANENILDYSEK